MLAKLRSMLPDERHSQLIALSDHQLEKMAATLEQMGAGSDDERRTPRRTVISRVEVVASFDGEQRTLAGVQEDSSPQGASVVIPKPIVVGTRVRVVQRNASRDGIVRNCRQDDSGWVVGIEYDHAAQSPTAD